MFYATQIKSVHSGGAIDVSGRSLRFIGYLPVKAGDTVYTDGKVIFGNAPPKGAPAIFDEQSGIPISATTVPPRHSDLRGYFTPQGRYKSYRIAGNNWIVNDKRKYQHDTDSADIIDAEIATDGSLLTAEKKVSQIAPYEDNNTSVLFYLYYSAYTWEATRQHYYTMLNFDRYTRGVNTDFLYYQNWWLLSKYASSLSIDYINYNMPTIIQANRDSGRFFDNEFIIEKDGDTVVIDCEIIIKKDNKEIETLKLSNFAKSAEEIAMKYVDITIPLDSPKEFLQSRATLLNFKILPDGKWTSLFMIEIGAERDYLNRDGEWGSGCTYDTLAQYCSKLGYSTAAVHSLFLFKVDSDGNYEKLAERSHFMPLLFHNNVRLKAYIIPFHIGDSEIPPFVANKTTFPYDDCYYSGWHENLGTGEGERFYDAYTVYDSRLLPNYRANVKDVTNIFYLPIQDGYQASIRNLGEDIEYWQFGGVFDSDGNQVLGTFPQLASKSDAHTWNMSLAKLKSGGYLVGIHQDAKRSIDGALYKITDSSFELIGDGLKNFRLRELKNISKAKR